MRLEARFGEQVRILRSERELTQEELANRCGLSVDSIRRIERGELSPSLSTMTKLARGLELRLRTLFRGVDRDNKQEHMVDQICDLLHHRTPNEVRWARQVLEAMLAPAEER